MPNPANPWPYAQPPLSKVPKDGRFFAGDKEVFDLLRQLGHEPRKLITTALALDPRMKRTHVRDLSLCGDPQLQIASVAWPVITYRDIPELCASE